MINLVTDTSSSIVPCIHLSARWQLIISVFLSHPSWAKNIDCFKHCALSMTCWRTVREVTRLQKVGDNYCIIHLLLPFLPSENLQERPLRKRTCKCEGAAPVFYRSLEHRRLSICPPRIQTFFAVSLTCSVRR